MSYPLQLNRLHATLESLLGIHSVSSGMQSLQGILVEDLHLLDYASLPIGAIRRTNGGLDFEALIQIEFQLHPETNSWRVLEFLAWFVRDQSRSGLALQLRPFALPPQASSQIQLGHTLRWHMDLFCPNTSSDLSSPLQQIEQIAIDLELAIKIYNKALSEGHNA